MDGKCFICDGTQFVQRTAEYLSCTACGHEILKNDMGQGYIVNDPLDADAVRRVDRLDRFKNALMSNWIGSDLRLHLLDVGSASGKFLNMQKGLFQHVTGIEITPEVRKFSVDVLGLDVRDHIDQVHEPISVATFWHSLEHIPVDQIAIIFENLAGNMQAGAKVIISVPNNASFQYAWFGRSYAFFDVPNHIHQFSPQSLTRLLEKYGFVEEKQACSWPYNVFGYIQGLLNIMTRSHNYLYYHLKRKSGERSYFHLALNLLFLPVAVCAGTVLSIMDFIVPNKQSVITVCFQKT